MRTYNIIIWAYSLLHCGIAGTNINPEIEKNPLLYTTKYNVDYDNSTIKEVVEDLVLRYGIELSMGVVDKRIAMKGNNIPYWDLMGNLAQQTMFGIYVSSGPIIAVVDPAISSYGVSGPFLIYPQNDPNTGQLILNMVFYLEDTLVLEAKPVLNVDLCKGGEDVTISGKTVLTTDGFEWRSTKPVKIEKGIVIKGDILTRICTGQYVWRNVNANSEAKAFGFHVRVNATSTYQPPILNPLGSNGISKPKKLIGKWIQVMIQPDGLLTKTEREFITQINHDFTQQKRIVDNDMTRYKRIYNRMPIIKADCVWRYKEDENGLDSMSTKTPEQFHELLQKWYDQMISRGNIYGIDTEVHFDSMIKGECVFPIGLLFRKYELEKLNFSINIPGDI